MIELNPDLVTLARWKLENWQKKIKTQTKSGFVPMPGGAPPNQGEAPVDPSVLAALLGGGGGGGGMPMDPSMLAALGGGGGGGMPMDPSMLAALGGGGGGGMPTDPSMLAGAVGGGAQTPTSPTAEGTSTTSTAAIPENAKRNKIDPTALFIELLRVRKLLVGLYKHLGLALPPDIIDDTEILAPGVSTEAKK